MATILVIDDSEIIVKVLARQLKGAGYEVIALTDPSLAVVKVLRMKPDLVLLDVHIPQLDGHKFCQSIGEWTTIWLHSAQADGSLKATAAHWGAHGYLGKGWDLEQKLSAIRSRIGA